MFISDIKYNHDENRKRKETRGRQQQEDPVLNCGVVIFSARRTQVCALKKTLFSLVAYRTLVFQDPLKTIVCLSVKMLVPWSPESPSVPTTTHRSSFSCQSHTWPVVSSGP